MKILCNLSLRRTCTRARKGTIISHNLIGIMFLPLLISTQGFGQEGLHNIMHHRILSPYQGDSTTIRILLPDEYQSNKTYRVLYVLPVVAHDQRRFGDGLLEIARSDFQNIYQLICVAPEFSAAPWFADHASDLTKQDESHFIKVVVPFIDAQYSTVSDLGGRLLLGFSKSGWGALTLLLRNPNLFDKAVGWDIGIRVDAGPISETDRYDRIEKIFGNAANFDNYRISTLLKKNGTALGKRERILYYNVSGKRASGGAKIHSLMVDLDVPHRYVFEAHRKHRWDSGWLPKGIHFLVGDAREN